jgi:hypothetical protein
MVRFTYGAIRYRYCALRVIQNWCTGIDEISQQLQQLNRYLNGSLNGASIHFHAPASLSDDYRATIISLGLQPHILALLLKFRTLYNKEWHDRFPIQASAFSLTPIQDLLNDVRQRAIDGGASTPPLLDYIDNLLVFDVQPKSDISMLEVVERMQVFDWNLGSKRYHAFMSLCKSTFNYQLPEFIDKWVAWRSSDTTKLCLDVKNKFGSATAGRKAECKLCLHLQAKPALQ